MRKIRYWLYAFWWLWKNRKWEDTRQKKKALKRDLERWLYKCR